MTTAYIAIGSNLGDRQLNLQAAADGLSALPRTQVSATSSVYEGAALVMPGAEHQPDFLNAVISVATELAALDLLDACLEIERAQGRLREPGLRWQARTLDMDLVAYGSETINTDRLTVPHPRMAERRFVLEPLCEIAPDLWIPEPFESRVRYLLDYCPDPHPLRRTQQHLTTASRP